MTKSTDSKNIKKIVQAVLASNGIDLDANLKLEIDFVEAFKRYVFERDKGESPADARQRVTDDIVGTMVALEQQGADMELFRRRVETSLVKSPNWDSAKDDWFEFDRWLYGKEQDGQTIEQFMTWWRSDDFRAKSDIWLKPSKIKEYWPHAFTTRTNEERPEYQAVKHEQVKAIPNPMQKPRLT